MHLSSTPLHPAMPVPSSRDRERVIAVAILAGIILLGFALRAYRLDRESLWTDEAMSIRVASGSFATITAFTAQQDVHPPLYYFALHVWMRLFGTSVVAVRLLSAIFGALAIPLLYRAGARVFDRTTGLVAAVFLATTAFHAVYGQEARMYSLLALLSLWSMDSSFRLLRGAGRPTVVGYSVSTALMLYTHVYGVFVVAAEIASAALLFALERETFRRVWKSFVLAQSLALLLYLPWLIVLARQVSDVEQSYWISRVGLVGVWSAISTYAGSWALSKALRVLALVGAAVGLLGLPRRSGPVRWATFTLLLWMGGPLVVPWVISQFSAPIFLARCTIAASLAFYLLAARGVTLVPARLLRVALVAAILVLNGIAVRGYFSVVAKDQWREAAARIGALAQPGDLLLFDRAYGQMPFDYYLTRRDLQEAPCLDGAETLPVSAIADRIDRLVDGHDRVWLVVSNADRVVPVALDRLGRRSALEQAERWRGIQAYLFVVRERSSTALRR